MRDGAIIFDLDGTLIDSSERLYRLFQELVPQSRLSKEEYWRLKRSKINHRMILERWFPDVEVESFESQWMSLIEDESYLSLDKCYSDTVVVLGDLARNHELFLLTARQSESSLSNELIELGIARFFSKVMATGVKRTKKNMLDMLEQAKRIAFSESAFVGDTGADISVGSEKGLRTIAISHGFMSRDKLLEYSPDIIVDELSELIGILECEF